MKKLTIQFVWLFIVQLVNSSLTSASHLSGGSITYTYISPLTYEVSLTYYHECSGVPASSMISVCAYSSSTGQSALANLSQTGPPKPFALNICDFNYLSSCMGGPKPGFEEINYSTIWTLPVAANDWIFSHSDCCMSVILSNVVQGQGMSLLAELDNLTNLVNSSPVFLSPPVQNFCINVFSVYDFSCSDADGDSLAYKLIPCSENFMCLSNGNPVIYSPGYSPDSFMTSSTPIFLDPVTGMLSFTPVLQQGVVVCVEVEEYRNGMKIGSIMRNVILTTGLPSSGNLIRGKVFLDQNYNYIYDSGDTPLGYMVPEVTPGPFYSCTAPSGNYTIAIPDTGYFIHSLPYVSSALNVIQNQQSSYFPGFGNCDSNNDFIVQLIPGIADLQVSISKFGSMWSTHRYFINYMNAGSDTLSGTTSLRFDSILQFQSCQPSQAYLLNDSIAWNYSNLMPLEQRFITIDFTTMNVAPSTPVYLQAAVMPVAGDVTGFNNYFLLIDTINAPFDPNCKKVSPPGDIGLLQVQNQEDLIYTIHFQNTGTDTAITVVITDALDQDLFIPSFRMEGSSDSCLISMDSIGRLRFEFPEILLPDSGADQLGSCGFVSYRIKPKNSLLPGAVITNEANIYFDNNAPVLTGQTVTHVVSGNSTVDIGNSEDKLWYPNPASDKIWFYSLPEGKTRVSVFDYSGRIIKDCIVSLKNPCISIQPLPSGVYIMKLENNLNSTYGKLMVIH